jgi:hypothetical protein
VKLRSAAKAVSDALWTSLYTRPPPLAARGGSPGWGYAALLICRRARPVDRNPRVLRWQPPRNNTPRSLPTGSFCLFDGG